MIGAVALALAAAVVFTYFQLSGRLIRGEPRGSAEEVYALVRDKVSKSAAVAVNLPEGVSLAVEEAESNISFDPPIAGKWAESGSAKVLLFQPSKELREGTHVTVSLKMTDGTLSKDFFVDEDPRILSIFPRADSEAPEYSEITIVFNRPMVPLTTLDLLGEKDVPVEVTPATKGKWKWITTRNLQFIPETRLQRAATYTVSVKDSLVSADGLPVAGMKHTFTTHPLRYEREESTVGAHPQQLTREPLIIRFNQPVDLVQTTAQISVRKTSGDNRAVPVIVEYGTRTLEDEKGKSRTYLDKSVLAVYGAYDRFGRERLWDFNTSYAISVAGAVPLEGDALLREARAFMFFVPEVIAEVTATSPRTAHASAELFDPQGKLIIRFYEDIDKGASSIKAPHLREIEYGERCKMDADGSYRYTRGECEKEADRKVLHLTFAPDEFRHGEEIPIEIRKLVNTDGVSLLPDARELIAAVYPELRIIRTSPEHGEKNARLDGLTVCSNTPLQKPKDDEFYGKTIASNLSLGRWNWWDSFRVVQPSRESPCAVGEFETRVRYGLIPESQYEMTLTARDAFGATTLRELSLRSGKVDGMYRRLTHLQKAYNVTSPERTKLVYAAENLEYVNISVCEVGATAMARYIDMQGRPESTVAGENLGCVRTVQRRIELPKRYWDVNYFELDLGALTGRKVGHYIVSLGHPEYRRSVWNRDTGRSDGNVPVYERTFVTVTNLAVQEKKIESAEWRQDDLPGMTSAAQEVKGGNLYWVTKFGSLEPVAGARVDLYRNDLPAAQGTAQAGGLTWAAGGTTNTEGIARTPVAVRVESAIVSYQGDSAIVSSQLDKFQWASALGAARKTYIYTDRPIYRPGEGVHVKGIYRIGYDGEYESMEGQTGSVTVTNSRNETIHTENVAVNGYGTFSLSLDLPKDAPLGYYRIEGFGGYGGFDVEEYVPAAFNVELSSAKEEYIAGDALRLTVDASYFFGVPVEEGSDISYSIVTQDYHFDRYDDKDGYFQFGKGWYSWEFDRYGDAFVKRGKAKLGGKGIAVIDEPLDFAELFRPDERDKSKIFIVHVSVKNREGQTVSAQKSLIVHRGGVYLGANLKDRYFSVNQPNTILVKSVDTEGKNVAVGGIEAVISKVTWETFRREEVDGHFYARSEKKKTPVKTVRLRTDERGLASEDFTIDEEGEYELRVVATDRGGNTVATEVDFYVYGKGSVNVRPTNNETLELAVDRDRLKVGESAEVVIKSPFERGKALVTVERGRIFEYRILDVTQSLINVTVPMKEEYIPNVYLSVILLSPRPEVKYGQVEFSLSSKEKELSVSVTPDKKLYLPGEEVTLTVETKDSEGRPVPAEVSVAVADLSVLALKGNPKKNPVAFFYGGLPLGVGTASNVKNILYEAEIPKGTKGGGGSDPEDLARKKRGIFKSTAFWQANVVTDESGRKTVRFTLPDNLTTWQSEAVAVTPDTKVGAGYSEMIAAKELMVAPLRPRFIVPGDTFKLGAKVFNETDDALRVTVTALSPSLELTSAKNAFIKLDPHASAAVYFDAKAPDGVDNGSHPFTIRAEAGTELDIIEDTISITENQTYESVATAFSTAEPRAKEQLFLPLGLVQDKGSLKVNVSSTLSMYMNGAWEYLVEYPYGCSEQLASKLAAIATLRRSYDAKGRLSEWNKIAVAYDGSKYTPDELVKIGLARIAANQTASGGFAYYGGMEPNFYLTLHVLGTLEDIRAAGYTVDASVMARASSFVGSELRTIQNWHTDKDLIVLTAYTQGRLAPGFGRSESLAPNIIETANSRKFVREDASNLSLAYLALTLSSGSYPQNLQGEVLTALESRLTVDGRGAFIRVADTALYDFYETPIKDTALLLEAWTVAKKDHPLADKVLRYLMRSRSKDGSWGSTANSLAVLRAFSGYSGWKREVDSHFTLSILLDGQLAQSFTFDRSTNETVQKWELPVSRIGQGKLHTLQFSKENLNPLPNTFYYDVSLTYFLPITSIGARDEGFSVRRSFYRFDDKEGATPVNDAKVGEVMRGKIVLTAPKERRLVAVESFIPAGVELVNFKLSTEDQSLRESEHNDKAMGVKSGRLFAGAGASEELPDDAYGIPVRHEKLFVDAAESHDDRLFLFREQLSAGVYEYEFFVRALVPGTFQVLPTVASEMYFPENFGRTAGTEFIIHD